MKNKCNVMQVTCVSVFVTIVLLIFFYYIQLIVQHASSLEMMSAFESQQVGSNIFFMIIGSIPMVLFKGFWGKGRLRTLLSIN